MGRERSILSALGHEVSLLGKLHKYKTGPLSHGRKVLFDGDRDGIIKQPFELTTPHDIVILCTEGLTKRLEEQDILDYVLAFQRAPDDI